MVSSQLSFGVLGPLEVRRDAGAVPLPSLRQRAVLAALLVHAGRPVRTDVLIEAAWAEELPANPRPALHTLLSRLRGILGVDAIRGEPAGYRLAVEPEAVDAARFEVRHRQARDAPAPQARELLERAMAMWRGPAYAEFADRGFASAEAVRLDELRLACAEDLAEVRIEVGDATAALPALEGLVGEHPLRERARGLLMTARYRAGRVSEALAAYHDYRTVLAEELGLDPSPALRDLHQRLLSHEVNAGAPARPRTAVASGSPRPVSDAPMVGRNDEAALLAGLADEHRLVTVTGAGGVGKTRLVTEACADLAARRALPLTVVELASTAAHRVDVAVAAGLGVGPAAGDTREAVLDFLRVVPALLVLDSCEHALPAVRSFVQSALRRCPDLRIVATSRQRIGLPAEQVLPLEPLATPGADSPDATLTAAVRLFADRARRVRPGFVLTDAVVPAVADLCRRLDGLPLAIELAATRAATLGVEPLRERLDRSLDLLDDGGTTGERSLRAVLGGSYDLLDRPDRRLLAALGVFEGEFDLDGAEQVAAPVVDRPVAVGLARLADASLVTARDTPGTPRYRLLHLVRAFAVERLAETGAEREVRAAHARWVRATVRAAADIAPGPGDVAAIDRVNAIAASLQSAVAWALQTGEAELAADIAEALMLLASARWQLRLDLVEVVRQVARHPAARHPPVATRATAAGALAATQMGDLDEGEQAALAVLDQAGAAPAGATGAGGRFLAQLALGIVTLYRGDYQSSRRAWRELLAVPGLPPVRQVNGHASLALIACYDGDLRNAQAHAAQATALAGAAGGEASLAFARYVTAEIAAAEDLVTAVPLLEAAVREADRAGVDFTAGLAATALAAALTRLGRTPEGLDVLGPLLERWLRLAAWPQLWTTLRVFAELLARSDRAEEAALLVAAADRAPSAPAVTGVHAEGYGRLAGSLRERVGPQAYEKIAMLAGALPRTAIVERARAAVSDLRTGDPDSSAAPSAG